jgi:hypothetical protein
MPEIENCFHSELTVVDSDGNNKKFSAWELTQDQLRTLFRSLDEKAISKNRVRIAVRRTRSQESIRMAQKREYIPGYQSQNKRPENLARIIAERKTRLS